MAKIQANGVDFYYELYGKGEPLVLISGYDGNHTQWADFIEPITKKYKLLIFDNQGVGQTSDEGNPLTIEDMADNTVALCKKLGLGKFSVAGHSMGGSIAQMIAVRHPKVINKLILSCSSAKWNDVTIYAFETIFKLIENNVSAELLYEIFTPWCYGRDFLNNYEKMEFRKKTILENPYPSSVTNMRRQFLALKQFDSRSQIKKITAPTLVISAFEDLVALPKDTKILIDNIPNAITKEFNSGHMATLERTDKWIDCVMNFLNS